MSVHITTQRLVLRPYRAEDSDAVVKLLNNFNVSRWLGRVPHPFAHSDLRIVNPDGSSRWPNLAAITMNDVVIGGIGLNDHLGYWIGEDYWGQGIATEAAKSMADYAFEASDVDKIGSGYFDGNIASGRVLEKVGFTEIGRGMNFSASNGRDMPHVDMVLTRVNWEAAK